MSTLAAVTIAAWSLTAFLAWITGRWLTLEKVETKNGTYKRASQPVVYWINVAVIGILMLGFLGASIFVTAASLGILK